MKTVVSILCAILLISGCNGQKGYLGLRVSRPIGDIFNVTFSDSTQFTRWGSYGTWTYSEDGLSISGTGTNDGGNILSYTNWVTDLEKSVCELTFTPIEDGAGIGVGFAASNSQNMLGKISLTGSTKGRLYFDGGFGNNRANSGDSLFTVINGDEHKLTVTRTPDSIFVTILNTVTGATQTLSYKVDYTLDGNFDSYKAGKIALFWLGGSQKVTRLRYYTDIYSSPKMVFTGDSNMQGAYADSNNARYAIRLANAVKDRIEIVAGAGNTSQDVVNLLPEILLINPEAVFVNIGTNGITQANIDTIRNVLVRNNIKIYLGTIFPTTSGVNANNSIIRGESGVTLIDFDSTLLNGGSVLYAGYAANSIHLNAAGNNAVYTQLLSDLIPYLTLK